MSNFIAEIIAKLNTSGIPDEIKKIENNKIIFRNITFETSKLASNIQTAISNGKFTVDLGKVNASAISGQMQKFGSDSAKSFSSAFNSSLNNIALKNGNLNALKTMLELQGLNDQSIAQATQQLDKMILNIEKIKTSLSQNGNINLKLTGTDELGRSVEIIRDFNALTGEIKDTKNSFAQSFTGDAEQFQKQVNSALKTLLNLDKEISALEGKTLGLDENSNEFKVLTEQISELNNQYKALFEKHSDNFSDEQLKQLDSTIASTTDKVQLLDAKLSDTKQELAQKIKVDLSSGGISSSISDIEAKYSQLGNVGQEELSKIKENIQQLKALQTAMANSNTPDELISNYEKFNATLSKTKNSLTIASNKAKTYVSSLQVKTLDNKMATWLEKNSRAVKDFGDRINNLRKKLASLNLLGADSSIEFSNITEEFKNIDQEAEAAGKKRKKFTDQFKGAFKSISNYVSVSSVLYESINALKEMYQNVYKIDTAMINLKKVTDETDSRYNQFLNSAKSNAQELGRTVSSLVEQTANWSKLGYSLSDSEQLAKISSIYANVGEVDDDTAVGDMVSAMKAFNIEAADAVSIVDALNELGNKFATDSASLGEGLSRSAASMSVAGSDLNETLAMLTGITEITQDSAEAGNFLKVGSMRIRGMTGDLEELGEEVDDSVDSISKVQTQILNLTHGNVNIFDENGNFRDYYKIMEEISSVFDTLSSTEQASLTEILFGKQRGNTGSALIKAFQSGQVQKALETANNSEGSASAEQAAWMEGLEAKTQQLQAAWESLSETVLSSDLLKNLIDSGTTLLNIIDSLVSKAGVFPTTLAAIAAGLSAVKNVGRDKMLSLVLNMPTVINFCRIRQFRYYVR